MRVLALLPLLALGLTGCATTGGSPYFALVDGAKYEMDARQIQAPCRLPFRVCINRTGLSGQSTKVTLTPYFASAKSKPDFDPAECDLGLRYNSPWNDFVDVYSTATKEKLGYIQGSAMSATANAVCHALAVGGPLSGKGGLPAYPAWNGNAMSVAPMLAQIPAAKSGDANSASPAAPPLAAPRYSAPERADDLAVIVGIETYSDIATKAPYAERDADAFKAHVRALGVPERNIALLKGAKAGRAALAKNLETWLGRLAKPTSRVYVYFSGHGAPDVKTGQAYLVPWDGDPNFLEDTAYPVAKLYKTLGALPSKQVLVAMDSCFSGAGGRSVLASGARPLVAKIETGAIPAKLTVLSASAGGEMSGSLDDRQHGAFTWFLLEGMNAGKTTPKALAEYLTPRVQDEAKRLNRDQTPQLQGDGSWSLR